MKLWFGFGSRVAVRPRKGTVIIDYVRLVDDNECDGWRTFKIRYRGDSPDFDRLDIRIHQE